MRVIQDSDDEFEEDLEVVPIAPKIADASTTQHEQGKDTSSGTGSTGMLIKAMTNPLTDEVSRIVEESLCGSPSQPSSVAFRSFWCTLSDRATIFSVTS